MKMYIKKDATTTPIANVSIDKVYEVIERDKSYVYIINNIGNKVGIAYIAVIFVEKPLTIETVLVNQSLKRLDKIDSIDLTEVKNAIDILYSLSDVEDDNIALLQVGILGNVLKTLKDKSKDNDTEENKVTYMIENSKGKFVKHFSTVDSCVNGLYKFGYEWICTKEITEALIFTDLEEATETLKILNDTINDYTIVPMFDIPYELMIKVEIPIEDDKNGDEAPPANFDEIL